MRNYIIGAALGCLALLVVSFVMGFGIGYTFRRLYQLIELAMLELSDHIKQHEQEDSPEPQIIDDDKVQAVKAERKRQGEEEPDTSESQIVNTKTPHQLQEERDKAAEAKLDKWMPGVKRGKS